MNALYHTAAIEGYLSQYTPLPDNIIASINYLKDMSAAKVNALSPVEKKKKRKMTKEQREKNLANLAKMREAMRLKREAAKAPKLAA